jgi:hypothetical protein
MLSQLNIRATAVARNSRGYRPTRRFATCSPFLCKVSQFRVSQFRGSVQSADSVDTWNMCRAGFRGGGLGFRDERLRNAGRPVGEAHSFHFDRGPAGWRGSRIEVWSARPCSMAMQDLAVLADSVDTWNMCRAGFRGGGLGFRDERLRNAGRPGGQAHSFHFDHGPAGGQGSRIEV